MSDWLEKLLWVVVGAVGKEGVAWLFSLIRQAETRQGIKRKVAGFFSPANRSVMLYAGNVAWWIAVLFHLTRQSGPPSRFETLLIVGAVVFLLIMVVSLIVQLGSMAHDRERLKRAREQEAKDGTP